MSRYGQTPRKKEQSAVFQFPRFNQLQRRGCSDGGDRRSRHRQEPTGQRCREGRQAQVSAVSSGGPLLQSGTKYQEVRNNRRCFHQLSIEIGGGASSSDGPEQRDKCETHSFLFEEWAVRCGCHRGGQRGKGQQYLEMCKQTPRCVRSRCKLCRESSQDAAACHSWSRLLI
jgi:hypothetical protein